MHVHLPPQHHCLVVDGVPQQPQGKARYSEGGRIYLWRTHVLWVLLTSRFPLWGLRKQSFSRLEKKAKAQLQLYDFLWEWSPQGVGLIWRESIYCLSRRLKQHHLPIEASAVTDQCRFTGCTPLAPYAFLRQIMCWPSGLQIPKKGLRIVSVFFLLSSSSSQPVMAPFTAFYKTRGLKALHVVHYGLDSLTYCINTLKLISKPNHMNRNKSSLSASSTQTAFS